MGAAGSVSNGVDAADIRNETDPTAPCKLQARSCKLEAGNRRCLGTRLEEKKREKMSLGAVADVTGAIWEKYGSNRGSRVMILSAWYRVQRVQTTMMN